MNRWDLEETYTLVRKAFGKDQERLASASAQSVAERQSFARFHYHEARRLQRAFERKHLADGRLLDMHTWNGMQKRVAFDAFMVKAGAHATAAIQSVHCIPDILAHALYYSTGQAIRSDAISSRAITVESVANRLAGDGRLCSLAAMLRQTRSGTSWHHLDAVANNSKHRSVVRAILNEDWTGSRRNFRELHVSAFERDGQTYPAVSFQTLLEPEYDRLSKLVVEIGQALTTYLRAIAG